MSKDIDSTGAEQAYVTAYTAHYRTGDLPRAVQLYRAIVISNPDALEASYSRMQIQNITRSVVSKQKLLDVQVSLLMNHFEHERSSHIEVCRTPPLKAS